MKRILSIIACVDATQISAVTSHLEGKNFCFSDGCIIFLCLGFYILKQIFNFANRTQWYTVVQK